MPVNKVDGNIDCEFLPWRVALYGNVSEMLCCLLSIASTTSALISFILPLLSLLVTVVLLYWHDGSNDNNLATYATICICVYSSSAVRVHSDNFHSPALLLLLLLVLFIIPFLLYEVKWLLLNAVDFGLFLLTTIPHIYYSSHGNNSPITAKHNRSQATSTGIILVSFCKCEWFVSVFILPLSTLLFWLLLILLIWICYADSGEVAVRIFFADNAVYRGTEDVNVNFEFYFVLSLHLFWLQECCDDFARDDANA